MHHSRTRAIAAAITAAMLSLPVQAFAQSAGSCTQNWALWDYYSNGDYVGSGWEPNGVSCSPGDGGVDGSPFPGGGGGGGGGGGEPATACQSHDPPTVDNYSDALAVDAADAIRARSDSTRREYGALIHRDAGGSLRLTPLVPGTPTSVLYDFSDLGVNPARIVGFIHNHPREVYDSSPQELQINLNPSSKDWQTATQIVNAGANADLLQLYIVGTDGVLRQFDYNNRASYQPRRTTNGYGVTPGETVPTDLVASPCP